MSKAGKSKKRRKHSTGSIGNMNGGWALLFKIILVTLVPWVTWVTKTLYENKPPTWVVKILESHEDRVRELEGYHKAPHNNEP